MTRNIHLSPIWRRWTVVLVSIVVLMATPVSAEHVLRITSISPNINETAEKFSLGFDGGLVDDGQPPAPNPAIPFNLSFEWQWIQGSVISKFDRATFEGVPANERFWTFDFGLSTGFTTNASGQYDGLLALEFFLRGEHLNGPSADDVDPNNLPLIRSDPITAGRFNFILHKVSRNQVPHPHTSPPGGIDVYGFITQFKIGDDLTDLMLPIPGISSARPVLTIAAQHFHPPPPSRPGAPPKQTGMRLGADESFAFFDAGTSSVVFSSGEIDTATVGGSGSGALLGSTSIAAASVVDPQFAGDPLIDAFSVFRIESDGVFNQLSYLGFDADRQLHVFSGGSLLIDNFGGADFIFNATFEELLYDTVSGDFFAILDTVNYTDLLNTVPSEFLDQFTDAHLFGGDPTSRGIQFTFNMPGLAEATNGFAETYFPNDPVGLYLTGVLIPEPTSLALMLTALAGGLLLRRF